MKKLLEKLLKILQHDSTHPYAVAAVAAAAAAAIFAN